MYLGLDARIFVVLLKFPLCPFFDDDARAFLAQHLTIVYFITSSVDTKILNSDT